MSRASRYLLGVGFASLCVIGLINGDAWRQVLTVVLSFVAIVGIVVALCLMDDARKD